MITRPIEQSCSINRSCSIPFDRQIASMSPKVRGNAIVSSLQKGLLELRPLVSVAGNESISAKSVEQVNEVTTRLRKIHFALKSLAHNAT